MGNPIEMRDTKPVEPGHNVRLTLDANLQDRAEEVLNEVGRDVAAQGRDRDRDGPQQRRDPRARELAARERQRARGGARRTRAQNRAVGATYEPGSTFKAFTVAAALEDGKVTPDTKFNIPPMLQVADREIKDAEDARLRDACHVSEILKVSSNIGAVLIAQPGRARSRSTPGSTSGASASRPASTCRARSSGLVLPLEGVLGRDAWATCRSARASRVTPMQMAAGYAAIANGGILRPPHIVASVGGTQDASSRPASA